MSNLVIDGRKKETLIDTYNGYTIIAFKNSDKSYDVVKYRNGLVSQLVFIAESVDKETAEKALNNFINKQESLKDATFKQYKLIVSIDNNEIDIILDSNDDLKAVKEYCKLYQDKNSVAILQDDKGEVISLIKKNDNGVVYVKNSLTAQKAFNSQSIETAKKDTKPMAKKDTVKRQKNNITIDDKTLERVEEIKQRAIDNNNIVMLSNTAKLGVKSWSLQAYNTCPASIDKDGLLVDACAGCYASFGNYRFSSVKATREYNRQTWNSDSFVSDFVKQLDTERYFRWFDSGDLYSLGLAKKVFEIMQLTPHVKHWLPTRMHKFSKFHSILKDMQALPNVVIRLSSDDIDGSIVDSSLIDTNSTILPMELIEGYNGFICPAINQGGRCNDCKACYSKDTKTVAYIAHGVKMTSNLKKLNIVNI